MVKQNDMQFTRLIVPVLLLALAFIIWLIFLREFRLDDAFITYRYARNFAAGQGLVYNVGDSVLSTTAPLYAVLLAVLSFIVRDFHVLGGLVSTLAIGAGGGLIYALIPRYIPVSIRIWAGVVYTLSSPLWLALGMETALWLALVLAAILLVRLDRWGWAGLLVGLAVLTRPEAALPGELQGLPAVIVTDNRSRTRNGWLKPLFLFSICAAVPLLIFGLWAWAAYGSPLPVTLGAKGAQAALGITGMGVDVETWEGLRLILRSLMAQSSLYIALGLLLVFGLAGTLSTPVILVVLWGALHLLAYVLLGVAPYRWYYAPLVPGAVLLAAHGLHYLHVRLKVRQPFITPYIVAAIAIFPLIAQGMSLGRITEMMQTGGPVDVMLPIVDWKVYEDVGDWLREETPLETTVGVAEVGQVGFFAERWMTDYLGLLQPDVAAALRRGDLYSWLAGYAPDYLVFQRFRGAALVLYNYVIADDPWFTTSYQPVTEFDDPRYAAGPVMIFERVTPLRSLNEQAITLDYGNLRLVGLATDGDSIPTNGGTVRVRLDWEMLGPLPPNLHLAVKGLDMNGQNPGFDGDYITENWSGRFSTWHGFVVPQGVESGQYVLLVAVGPTGGPFHEQGAGTLTIQSN